MILTNFIKELKSIRVEYRARQIESPAVQGLVLNLDRKCSVCRTWVHHNDNYCANCGAKFDKDKEEE
jgi:predicted amidophosphoribosyltransferase